MPVNDANKKRTLPNGNPAVLSKKRKGATHAMSHDELRDEEMRSLNPGSLTIQPFPTIVKNPGPKTVQAPNSPIERSQWTAWINILSTQDPDRKNGPWEKASLDTQAENSVIFKKRLNELGLANHFYDSPGLGSYTGVSSHEVRCVGDVNIRFTFEGVPDKVYEVKVDVLEDDPDDSKGPPFNILIGRPVLNKYELVTVDPTKIPNLGLVRKTCKL